MPSFAKLLLTTLSGAMLCLLALAAPSARGEEAEEGFAAASYAPLEDLGGPCEECVVSNEEACDLLGCGDPVDWAVEFEKPALGRANVVAMAEISTLWPSYSDDSLTIRHARAGVAPRVSVGWEGPEGFGVQARGWGIFNRSPYEYGPGYYGAPGSEIEYLATRMDFDLSRRFKHRRGDLAVGAGVTAAYFDYDQLIPSFSWLPGAVNLYDDGLLRRQSVMTSVSEVRNIGAGLGLMIEARHHLYDSPRHRVTMYGRGRIAELLANWRTSGLYSNSVRGESSMEISEAIVGLEYRRRYRYADALVHCGAEFQSWDLPIVGRFNLAGVTTGVGLNW